MSKRPVDAGSLKVGSYIVIDDAPCKVVEIEKSKTGKHGSAKVRIVAIGLFDGVKRSIVVPVDQKVEQPVIEKKSAQAIALTPDTVQLMDLSTYEVYEVPKSEVEPDLLTKITTGTEVEVWEVLGYRRVVRVK